MSMHKMDKDVEAELREKMVDFDIAKLERFKLAYNKVSGDNGKCFTFEGNRYIVGYAKYLIEYLNMELKKAHIWECISPGMYDDTYECKLCKQRHTTQADNPTATALPEGGCTGEQS